MNTVVVSLMLSWKDVDHRQTQQWGICPSVEEGGYVQGKRIHPSPG